jgi:DNA-binding protein H-NS
MTQSYQQIQKQIEVLQRKAEKLREQEIEGVIARIKVAIEHYGLTAEQLGFGAGGGRTKGKAAKASPGRAAKYSDGQGNSWSGMGKRPTWLREALEGGRTLEEFAIAAAASSPQSRNAKPAKSKKRPSKIAYRDDAGHTWSGMGPKPRWLKEALLAGKTLEQMAA